MDRAGGGASAAIREVLAEPCAGTVAPASLGLANLPDRLGNLSPGMLYSLACDQQAVRLPLAAGALAASLAAGKRCVLVTPGDPAMFLRKARFAGWALEAPLRGGALTILQLAADADKQLFRTGPEGLLRELEQNFEERGAFMVLDQADALFMLPDPRGSAEAAHCYLRWIAQREHIVLALFAPSALAPRDYFTLKRIAENFAGFAVVRASDGGGSLEIRHWFTAEGASPRESFSLGLHRSGTTSLAPQPAPDELPPVESVIFVRGAVQVAPGAWQEAECAAEALQAARRSEAATLVLPFRQAEDYAALCRTVAALRAMARPSLRVMVRECGLRLRAVQSLALLRLGASSIIPLDLGDAGARRMVDLLQGTRFARPYDTDLDALEPEISLLMARRPATAAAFCDAVERLLAAADGFDLDCCLVRLPVDGIDPAKLAARARQAGRDLLATAQRESVWLFVFGCPRDKLPALLERTWDAAVAGGPGRWAAEYAPERILADLESLRSPGQRAPA